MNVMRSSEAVSQTAAIIFVIALVLVAFAGYGLGYSNRPATIITKTATTIKGTSSAITVVTRLTSTTTSTSTVTSISTSTVTIGAIPVASVQTGNISIGGSPLTIAVNPDASRIYVIGLSNVLTVIDAVSHTVVARVTLPAVSNGGIAIDQKTGLIYVLVQGGIAEINGTTNTIFKELPIDFGVRSIAYDSSTDTIYGSSGSGYLIGFDARTGSVIANVSIGYWASDILINPQANLVYAIGCEYSFVCGSVASIVNVTSQKLLNKIQLDSPYYATAAIDETLGFVYVSGYAQLAKLSPLGTIIYDSYPDTCGPFQSMAVAPSLNEVIVAPQNYNYLLVYNGQFGNLVNMYSLPSAPQYVAFNPITNETYVTVSNSLLAFRGLATSGHINETLIGADQTCLLP